MKTLHPIQRKILTFLQKAQVTHIGLTQLGRFIDEKHPQQIKHHLEQLVAKKLISWNPDTNAIKVIKPMELETSALLVLPILGAASAGSATMVAKEDLEGYLKISKSTLGRKDIKGLFVVRVSGNSLNSAKDLPGGPAQDGDYAVIDSKYKNYRNGDYVLSVIDEHANLKRFYREGDQVVLVSESSSDIPPIYIHPTDFPDYTINGKIVKIFKNFKK